VEANNINIVINEIAVKTFSFLSPFYISWNNFLLTVPAFILPEKLNNVSVKG